MIRLGTGGRPVGHRKPRASGDDPQILAVPTTSDQVNPARAGMILKSMTPLSMRTVNPARAGMIPPAATVRAAGVSKPRASGDDPFPTFALTNNS